MNARRLRCPGLLVALLALVACRGPRPELPLLRVGTSGDYAPFSIAGESDLQGLDIEIASRFAEDTGHRVEFVRFKWSRLTQDLDAHRFDLAMGGVTMRPERAVHGTFSRPIAATGAVVLVRQGVRADVRDLDRGQIRIAVNGGGHLERVARRLFPHASVLPSTDNTTLPWLIESHAADALVIDDVEAYLMASRIPEPVERVGPLTHDRKAYLGTDPALVAALDGWLRAHEADGSLAELRARWLGPARADKRTAFDADVDALLALVDLRLALMPAVAAAKEKSGLPIGDPKQEEAVLGTVRRQAAAAGLDAGTVATFFGVQIAAARTVQRTYLTLPTSVRPVVDPLDLDRQLRPTIADLSEQIVRGAARVAADPTALASLDAEALAGALDTSMVPKRDRDAIATALKGLRRATAP